MVENYSKSIEIKKQQLESLEASVDSASKLFQNARVEYVEVLFAQRDLMDARMVLIDTKKEQLSAIVNAYQALGGGVLSISTPADFHGQFPYTHTVRSGENFWTISQLYYKSGRYYKALWAANKKAVPAPDRLTVGDKIIIPRPDQLDPALIEEGPAPAPPVPETVPADEPATSPRPRHHPQACLARSARRGPKTPPSRPPAAPNPPRPRRSRRRRGSDRPIRSWSDREGGNAHFVMVDYQTDARCQTQIRQVAVAVPSATHDLRELNSRPRSTAAGGYPAWHLLHSRHRRRVGLE